MPAAEPPLCGALFLHLHGLLDRHIRVSRRDGVFLADLQRLGDLDRDRRLRDALLVCLGRVLLAVEDKGDFLVPDRLAADRQRGGQLDLFALFDRADLRLLQRNLLPLGVQRQIILKLDLRAGLVGLAAAALLEKLLCDGDVLFAKGSRGVALEKALPVVDELL
jgi:hypothetical protein